MIVDVPTCGSWLDGGLLEEADAITDPRRRANVGRRIALGHNPQRMAFLT